VVIFGLVILSDQSNNRVPIGISTSFLQRRLRIGYPRAAALWKSWKKKASAENLANRTPKLEIYTQCSGEALASPITT
jgi:hypothetical protein